MIYGIASDNSIPNMGFALNVQAGAKAALPVSPSSLVYSHFKHVDGVPAPEGSQGVTISKLNILDALIEQMDRLNKPAARSDSDTAEYRLDAMIDSYRTQIFQARDTKPLQQYAPAQAERTGVLFSFTL